MSYAGRTTLNVKTGGHSSELSSSKSIRRSISLTVRLESRRGFSYLITKLSLK